MQNNRLLVYLFLEKDEIIGLLLIRDTLYKISA
jgi:hypothetical protein